MSHPLIYDSSLANPPLSQRTHELIAQSDMPSSTSPPQVRQSVPLLNSQARRFLIVRSPFNSPASQSQPGRRPRERPVEVRVLPGVKAGVADNLAVVVVADAVVVDEEDVLLVV
jgi:hypothetical protein